MNLKLINKIALVTGSSRGIGFSIAKVLQAEGCEIVLNGRNKNTLSLAKKSIPKAIDIIGDMTDIKSIQRIINKTIEIFGRLDILICNVGSGRSVSPGTETFEEWKRVFSINLWSAINTIEIARQWLSISQGAIVCISSICGIETIPNAPVTYSAAKAALHSYVRGIARPFAKEGIRINAVASGNILFEDSVWFDRLLNKKQETENMIQQEVALNCLGEPIDIANLVAYLASPCSKFATGKIWTIDGGQIRS